MTATVVQPAVATSSAMMAITCHALVPPDVGPGRRAASLLSRTRRDWTPRSRTFSPDPVDAASVSCRPGPGSLRVFSEELVCDRLAPGQGG